MAVIGHNRTGDVGVQISESIAIAFGEVRTHNASM